jgi:GH15 family glucan-1,4-alpha-glucosidase
LDASPHRAARMTADTLPAASAASAAYPPIGDYAIIGNCRTVALVSRHGSIDWLCLPCFSGPSLFAALLDQRHGGRFALTPREIVRIERAYLDHTNVLRTTFHCRNGAMQLTDFMMAVPPDNPLQPAHEIVRIVQCIDGEIALDAVYEPRPFYAARVPRLVHRGRLGWLCAERGMAAYLNTDIELASAGPGCLRGSATLHAGESRQALLDYSENDVGVINPLGAAVTHRLDTTVRWWNNWCAQCAYGGRYRDAVERSFLTLKLLAYSPSGAVIAAPTSSLPEGPRGDRNWDYRYCWLRDTSLVLQSFIDLGFYRESEAFLGWLLHATRLTQPRLQVVYDVFGETALDERILTQLEGYRGIGPVRVGNAAHEQLQLDVYGEVILTACSFASRGGKLDRYEQELLVGFGESVRALWRSPDRSIWEIRLPPRANTYSRLMCWTALDRLLQLHEMIGLRIDAPAFRRARDEIREDIEAHGYDAALQSYVGFYGGPYADASLLLMARYGYIEADYPRMVGTWRYIERTLSVDGLLYRYQSAGGAYDGLQGEENLFAICTFWLVDYLARLGEVDQAMALFDKLLGLANDVGLYAEEFDAKTQAPLGNFPQAFTHVGLITAALSIEQALAGKRGKEIAE